MVVGDKVGVGAGEEEEEVEEGKVIEMMVVLNMVRIEEEGEEGGEDGGEEGGEAKVVMTKEEVVVGVEITMGVGTIPMVTTVMATRVVIGDKVLMKEEDGEEAKAMAKDMVVGVEITQTKRGE